MKGRGFFIYGLESPSTKRDGLFASVWYCLQGINAVITAHTYSSYYSIPQSGSFCTLAWYTWSRKWFIAADALILGLSSLRYMLKAGH